MAFRDNPDAIGNDGHEGVPVASNVFVAPDPEPEEPRTPRRQR